MAKGLRASNKKANKARLRSNVFGPVEEARKERLSAKLLEIASKSKESSAGKDEMLDEVPAAEESSLQDVKATDHPETVDDDMDIEDVQMTASSNRKTSRRGGRIQKRQRKAKSSAVFPVYKNGVKSGAQAKGRRRK